MARSPRRPAPSSPFPLPPSSPSPPALSITISLQDIYAVLCPTCRDALVDLLAHKAGQATLRDALAAQLASALPSPPVRAGPRACPPDTP